MNSFALQGPLKLGDPYYRGLSKMENDPMLPARMRDTARSELCQESVREFSACTQKAGFALVYACTKERDALVKCIEGWLEVGIRALQVRSLTQFYTVDF